ncbi:MAG: glycosyltransferase family 4 protein [Pegethrix bostrychoides GSE-TBD4-15B]|jgi:glycosyltransferase involved in cell wall biosynthesis|uniref:Glycosyltransferase family 4 protein n=1 Tax=Pegethrix bostrychoides GSE-TBD4-15B TaxID=2839662 RepID=A0A951PEI9_9CYAN|nr:glycosyltransferase family 4 protein [Pegethrix bostrychoides GSE-TBD4-15B]
MSPKNSRQTSGQPHKRQDSLQIVMLGDSLTHNGGITSVEKLILRYSLSTVAVHHIATHESGSVAHRLKIFGLGLVQFIRCLLSHPVDLVHIHLADWGSIPRKAIAMLIALLFRKPVVMHAHGGEFHLSYQAMPAAGRWLLRRLFQRCCRFITLSKSWQNFYRDELDLAKRRVVILPNPIELPERIPDRQGHPGLTLLFMGKIGSRKGAFDLIQAFARLPDPAAQLWLAGDGELERAKALVTQLNLTDRVQILGWINAEQRRQMLAAADIFVLPSHNEALPMAMLEAMAWGLPVVSCPVGGIAEFVCSGQSGLLVPPGDIDQLSQALRRLMDDAALRQSLGQAARQVVMPLDVQRYVVELEQLYRDCLAGVEPKPELDCDGLEV